MQTAQVEKKLSKAVALVSRSEIYQKRLFIFFCVIWSQVAYNTLINPVILTNPLFLHNGQTSTQAYCCAQQNSNKCQYSNSFTGTYYANLYCENRETRMTLQSLFALGAALGAITVPMIGDLKGKRAAIYLSLLCMIVGNLCLFFGILNSVYILVGVGQILSALGSMAVATVSYSLSSDYFSDDLRQKSIMFYCAAWGLSDMSVLFTYYFIPGWISFLLIFLLIPTTCLLLYFKHFFIQSLHHQILVKNDFSEGYQIIQQLSKVNQADQGSLQQSKSTLKQIQSNFILHNRKKKQQSLIQMFRLIFGTLSYVKAIILLILVRMAFTLFYFGVQSSTQRIGFNFGVSMFLLGIGQFTGYYTGSKFIYYTAMFIPKFKRKTVIISANILLILLALAFKAKIVQESPLLASFLLYLCFILSSYSFGGISLVQTQSFPASIRSTSVGIQMGAVTTLRIIIPFIIGYFNQKQIPTVFGLGVLMAFLGVLPAFFMKETFGYSNLQKPLLDTAVQLQNRSQAKIDQF